MLQGKKLEADAAAPDVDEWVKTSYIYDVTLPYGQMLTETTGAVTTAYAYSLERISALSSALKTQYVYDGRGSVAQSVVNADVQSFAYTPFGEILAGKQTGFGFNAEWYDAATGMQNLRARQYEPAMMRFSQKDVIRGNPLIPISLNRYVYAYNCPTLYIDPSGMTVEKVREYERILAQLYDESGGRETTRTVYYENLLAKERKTTIDDLIRSAKRAADNKNLDTLTRAVNSLKLLEPYMSVAIRADFQKLKIMLDELVLQL